MLLNDLDQLCLESVRRSTDALTQTFARPTNSPSKGSLGISEDIKTGDLDKALATESKPEPKK